MAEIESLEEGGAFMDAADGILGLNHPMRDAEIARLRQAWIAGRDWQAQQPRSEGGDAEALRAALEEIETTLGALYCEQDVPDGPKRLPRALYPWAGPLGIIDHVVSKALASTQRPAEGGGRDG